MPHYELKKIWQETQLELNKVVIGRMCVFFFFFLTINCVFSEFPQKLQNPIPSFAKFIKSSENIKCLYNPELLIYLCLFSLYTVVHAIISRLLSSPYVAVGITLDLWKSLITAWLTGHRSDEKSNFNVVTHSR